MLDLIKQLDEVYQDVEVYGKIIAKGRRDCEARWEIIKKSIKPHDVVLDIGSSLGYYSHKIAKTFPDSLVISFESDPVMCEIQAKIFEKEGIYNVVVCQHRLSAEDLIKWSRHVEIFDKVLALAVLHHFPESLIDKTFDAMRDLGTTVIVELPAENETEACGGKSKAEAWRVTDKLEGEWLGSTTSHLGKYERGIVSYHGNNDKKNLDAFFGVDHIDRHRFEVKDGKIDGKHIIKGVNYHNLKVFNPVYPKKKWFKQQAISAYKCLEFKSDVRAWNLLVTSTGMKAIDFTTKFPKGDQAEFREDDYEKMFSK